MPAIFSHRRGRIIPVSKARLAPQPIAGRRASVVGRDPFFIEIGTLLLDAVAIRISAFYDIPASAFVWRSKDGLVDAYNETAFSGGALQDSGLGVGTVMRRIANADPFPTNSYLLDGE